MDLSASASQAGNQQHKRRFTGRRFISRHGACAMICHPLAARMAAKARAVRVPDGAGPAHRGPMPGYALNNLRY